MIVTILLFIMSLAFSSLGYLQEYQPEYLARYLSSLKVSEEDFLRGTQGDPEEHAEFLIEIDPVSWCEVNLEEKDGTPWAFWDYQKDILRFHGSRKLLSCGAETGKTRAIVAEAIWRAKVFGQEVAIFSAAGLQIKLLWQALDGQLKLIHLADSVVQKRQAPLHEIHFESGGSIILQTAGGETRGVHVDVIFVDEAADIHGEQVWADIFARLRAGGMIAFYSTPRFLNGRFYELVQDKVDGEELFDKRPELVDPLFWPLLAADGWSRDEIAASWVRFREKHKIPSLVGQHWSKRQAPEPHYSPSRERDFQAMYGPPDSTLYLINVEGRCAPPSDGVFPVRFVERSLDFIEHYREITISDSSADECIYRVRKLNPDYGTGVGEAYLGQILEMQQWKPVKKAPATHDSEAYRAAVTRLWNPILRPLVGSISWDGERIAGGADMARSGKDPTEILLFDVQDGRYICKLRLTLRSFANNAEQAGVIHALVDAVKNVRPGKYHWSFDAGGAVGSQLKPWMPREFTPIYFQEFIPEFNPIHGRKLRGDHVIRMKVGCTNVTNRRLADDQIVFPRLNEYLEQFSNHQHRTTPSGELQYSQEKDHLIDGTRLALYSDLRAFPPKTKKSNPDSAKKRAPTSKRAATRKKRFGKSQGRSA